MKNILCVESTVDGCKFLLCQKRDAITKKRGKTTDKALNDSKADLKAFLGKDKVDEVCLVLSTEKAAIRFTDTPKMSRAELDKAAFYLYGEHFPVDPEKYVFCCKPVQTSFRGQRVMLAALPAEAGASCVEFFEKMRLKLTRIELKESVADETLSLVEPVVFFDRQETSYSVYWVKNGMLQNTWRISDDPVLGPKELKAAFCELDEASKIHHCVLLGKTSDWVEKILKRYELEAKELGDPYASLAICAKSLGDGTGSNLLPPGPAAKKERSSSTRNAVLLLLGLLAASAFLVTTLSMNLEASKALAVTALDSEATLISLISQKEEAGALYKKAALAKSIDWRHGFQPEAIFDLCSRIPEGVELYGITCYNGTARLSLAAKDPNDLSGYADSLADAGYDVGVSRFSESEDISEMTLAVGTESGAQ
ncbi:MAG: hypothetical protein LBC41_02590 [Clostridiales bacterium]|jgi:hypothetical protein|nr:hypothetical protein [Clostridiales bacterium]